MILMNQFIVNDGALGVGWFLLFHLATFSVAIALYLNVEVIVIDTEIGTYQSIGELRIRIYGWSLKARTLS